MCRYTSTDSRIFATPRAAWSPHSNCKQSINFDIELHAVAHMHAVKFASCRFVCGFSISLRLTETARGTYTNILRLHYFTQQVWSHSVLCWRRQKSWLKFSRCLKVVCVDLIVLSIRWIELHAVAKVAICNSHTTTVCADPINPNISPFNMLASSKMPYGQLQLLFCPTRGSSGGGGREGLTDLYCTTPTDVPGLLVTL